MVRPLSSLAKFSFVISNIQFPPRKRARGGTPACLRATTRRETTPRRLSRRGFRQFSAGTAKCTDFHRSRFSFALSPLIRFLIILSHTLSAATDLERVAHPRLGGVLILPVAFDVMSLCPRDVSERPEHVAQAGLIDQGLELKHGFAAVLEVSHHSFLLRPDSFPMCYPGLVGGALDRLKPRFQNNSGLTQGCAGLAVAG